MISPDSGMNGSLELPSEMYIDYPYEDNENDENTTNDNDTEIKTPNFDIPGFDLMLGKSKSQYNNIDENSTSRNDVDQMMDYLEFGEGNYSGSSSSLSLNGENGHKGDNMFQDVFMNGRNSNRPDAMDLGLSPTSVSDTIKQEPLYNGIQGQALGQNLSQTLSSMQIPRQSISLPSSQPPSHPPTQPPTEPSSPILPLATTGNGQVLSSQYNQSYRDAQVLLSKLSFGKQTTASLHEDTAVSSTTEIISEILAHPEKCDTYKYKLYVAEIPSRSRVETQIKCRLIFSPTPDEHLLHLPSDTMARPRFQLKEKYVPQSNSLSLEVDVVAQNIPDKPLYMCPKCISREMKRAFRKKSLDPNEEHHWKPDKRRRIVIFNCREVVAFPLPKDCDIGNGQIVQGKEILLPLRLGCYCRHHGAKPGYKLIFTAKDYNGNVVARTISKTITITDDHKDIRTFSNDEVISGNNSLTNMSDVLLQQQQQQQQHHQQPQQQVKVENQSIPPSPVSMEESSEATDFSSSSVKRRRDSNWSGNIRPSSANNSTTNTFQMFVPSILQQAPSQSRLSSRNASFSRNKSSGNVDLSAHTSSDNLGSAISLNKYTPTTISRNNSFTPMTDGNCPQIQRIIPAQGSIRGGIEVTLLGTGFYNGLITKFGDNVAMTTQCWSDSTIVAHLPPATIAGPVVVTFEGITRVQPQIFTYIDDTDSQLIELALQVVGLKMNGKLEDAKNIAMRIVGTSNNDGTSGGSNPSNNPINGQALNSSIDHEKVILRCIDLIKLNTGKMPNWQLRNSEGQTMMHLAASLGYYKVVSSLISQGARIDQQDINGMTPLHFAALRGRKLIVRKLLRCRADPFIRGINGQSVIDIADNYVVDELPVGLTHRQYNEFSHARRTSSTSTFSSFKSNHRYEPTPEELPHESEYDNKNEYDDYDEEDSSDYDDGDLRMGDVRKALLRHRRMTSSISHSTNEIEEETEQSTDDNTVVNIDHPRNRFNNTAENISLYLQQLTETARNRMKPWERPNWDEIVNYIYRRSGTRNRGYISSAASDSDATVRTSRSRDIQQNNLLGVWQFLTQANEHNDAQVKGEVSQQVGPPHHDGASSPAPPSYDEIFPGGGGSQVTPSTDEKTESSGESGDIGENTDASHNASEDYEQEFIRTWVNNKKNLQNDGRLFFFWIPVLVLAITLVILRLSCATPEVYNNLFWTSKSNNKQPTPVGKPLSALASPMAIRQSSTKSEIVTIEPMCDLDNTKTLIEDLGIFI